MQVYKLYLLSVTNMTQQKKLRNSLPPTLTENV